MTRKTAPPTYTPAQVAALRTEADQAAAVRHAAELHAAVTCRHAGSLLAPVCQEAQAAATIACAAFDAAVHRYAEAVPALEFSYTYICISEREILAGVAALESEGK